MTKYITMVRLVALALGIVVLCALFGWYYFLAGKTSQTNLQSQEAGYDAVAPTFEGTTGSTYANVVSTLGAAPGTATSTTSRLWEVSAVPVAGFGWRSDAVPTLDFVEGSSGYVFEADTSNRDVARLTDTLRAKIYEASITRDGSVIERNIDANGALITFAGKVASSSAANATSTGQELSGADLPTDIGAMAADPISDTLFYTIPEPSGVSLVSSSINGTKEKQLFSSPIVGWQLSAPGDGTLVLSQDPLDGALGYAYQVQKNGALSLIAEAPGLTVMPRVSSTALLYGASSNGQLSLFARASAAATTQQLSIKTVADKCAWAPGPNLVAYCGVPRTVSSNTFLDDWYKGLTHTTDTFYKIDVSAASTTLLYDPTDDTQAQLDVEEVSVDPTGQYIAFINARDRSLWVLRIAQ